MAAIATMVRRSLSVPTDLGVRVDVIAMVSTTINTFGRIDVLVNNAAVTFVGDIDIPMRRHDLIMEVNLRAPLLAMREVVPGVKARRSGAIINISSVAALYPHAGLKHVRTARARGHHGIEGAKAHSGTPPPRELFDGLAELRETAFREPYPPGNDPA